MKISQIIILVITLCSGSCRLNMQEFDEDYATKRQQDEDEVKSFEEQRVFLMHNVKCEEQFEKDAYNTVDNKIFRCGVNSATAYIEIETDGVDSNNVIKAKMVWKKWKNHPNKELYVQRSSQLIAAFTKLYPYKKLEFVEKFVYEQKNETLKSKLYNIELSGKSGKLYDVRTAEVIIR